MGQKIILVNQYGEESINSLVSDLGANGHKIVDVADPSADQDAATKKYVDQHSSSPITTTITATSSVKPGVNNAWLAMTGNHVDLPVGTFDLSGIAAYADNGSSPAWNYVSCGWFGANGDDTSTAPAKLSVNPNVTNLSGGLLDLNTAFQLSAGANDAERIAPPSIRITVTAPVTVYLNCLALATTATDGLVTTYILARKIA